MPDLQPIVQKISTKYDSAGIAGFLKDLGKIPPQAGLAVAALGMTAGFMLDCAKAADQSQQITRQLNQTLETTGRISQVSTPQLQGFASALADMSTFDDESIMQAYTAIAQFERVPTDKIDELAIAAADMSAVMGGDIVKNARTLAGILDTGLVPESLRFTDALREQIQELVKAGDTGGALNLVLEAMGTKYGGQAQLALEGVSGAVQNLKNDWEDFREELGADETGPLHELIVGADRALEGLTSLYKMYSLLEKFGKTHKGASGDFALFLGLTDILSGNAAELQKVEESAKKAEAALSDFGDTVGDVNEEIVEASPKTRNWNETLSALADELNIGMLAAEDLARGINSIPKNTYVTVFTNYVTTGSSGGGTTIDNSGTPQSFPEPYPQREAGESWDSYAARCAAWKERQAAWIATHAKGGKLSEGWNLVGEEGMELIDPSGQVYPHDETKRMLAKGLRNVTGFAGGTFDPLNPGDLASKMSAVGGATGGFNPADAASAVSTIGGAVGADVSMPSANFVAQAAGMLQAIGAATSAASQASSASMAVSKSMNQLSNTQSEAQATNREQLEELRTINTNLEMWSSSIISEIQKALS
jgi:hypothetical protein